jgi:putative transposase
VTGRSRSAVVGYLCGELGTSERRACRLVGLHRSSYRYETIRSDDPALVARMREAAAERPRWGYRRLRDVLIADGFRINHKRMLRLCGNSFCAPSSSTQARPGAAAPCAAGRAPE